MVTGWPESKFIIGNQKPVLYICVHKLLLNRIRENKNGDKNAYFYCVNKVKNGVNCMSAAKAMILEQGIFCPNTPRFTQSFVYPGDRIVCSVCRMWESAAVCVAPSEHVSCSNWKAGGYCWGVACRYVMV